MPRAEKSKSPKRTTRKAKSSTARNAPRGASRKPAASKSWGIENLAAKAMTSTGVTARTKSPKKAATKMPTIKGTQLSPVRPKPAYKASSRKVSQSRSKTGRR